ncbi:MAG: hypothetical protein Kow0025_19080 [Thermodesulfovibrionales bacterium]
MGANPLLELKKAGVSAWIDFLSRELIKTGKLRRLMDEDGLAGVTSNPTIFMKAFGGSPDYDGRLKDLLGQGMKDAKDLLLNLAGWDVSGAADLLRPVYESTGGRDGYVSIEVSPDLAHKAEETVAEARRLSGEIVGRRNVYIKVPATREGLPAIERLIREGVSVNVTLLFSRKRYTEVTDAYLRGIEGRLKAGEPVDSVTSVASFFVSRVDTLVDKLLEGKLASAGSEAERDKLKGLMGKAAVANARLAYQDYKEIFSSRRFKDIHRGGGRIQRLLWGSTSTKNPAYRDVKYVEDLIGPDIINTMPEETIEAFRDHGKVAPTLERGLEEARAVLRDLEGVGIDFDAVTRQLEDEGVRKFSESYFEALDLVAEKRDGLLGKAAS